jgi:hypothetical protein
MGAWAELFEIRPVAFPAPVWPSRKAASARARPKPEETPVMRNVFAMRGPFQNVAELMSDLK